MIPQTMFDSRTFRQACGQFPTGVTAITAVTATGEYAALTANSFTSVSLDPAKVLFCLITTSSSFSVLRDAQRIAVHILGHEQEDTARRLATSGLTGAERLEGVDWTAGPDGVPVLADCPAILSGRTDEIIVSGDHSIFILDIDHLAVTEEEIPAITFYRGRFSTPPTPTAN